MKSVRNYEDDLIAILEEPQLILDHDETRLIDRDLIREALERTERNKEECVLDPADDALIVRLCELKSGAPWLADGRQGKYGHIVVDEVQDFAPTELASVIGAVQHSRNLTLVGDIAQKIDENSGFPGWDKLRKHWDFKESMSRFMGLTVSHRSTLPIMKLADYIQGKDVVKHGRQGRAPIWFKASTESKGLTQIIKWLSIALERFPDALTAVICQDEKEAKYALSLLTPTFGGAVRIGDSHSFSFEQGIIVTDIKQVKGLEFYNVVLWNPSAQAFPANELSRNLLYVAVTRAEENLCIVTWKKPTELLPAHNSKLVRGMFVDDQE
jgi:DNA helicase-2/ATP-dependent DNA helicase PcrA